MVRSKEMQRELRRAPHDSTQVEYPLNAVSASVHQDAATCSPMLFPAA